MFVKSVCVYCGSEVGKDPVYKNFAFKLGEKIAETGRKLVYGGRTVGLMGECARGSLSKNGEIVGVIPEKFYYSDLDNFGFTELIKISDSQNYDTFHMRKLEMFKRSDCFIALPGGLGTLDEFFEVATWHQVGKHKKPLGLLNVNGFWDDIIKHLKKITDNNFSKTSFENFVFEFKTIDEVLLRFEEYYKNIYK